MIVPDFGNVPGSTPPQSRRLWICAPRAGPWNCAAVARKCGC